MNLTFARRGLAILLMIAVPLWGLTTDTEARARGRQAVHDDVLTQVVVNPAASSAIGPARNWDRVDAAYRYYYGPNYGYDPGWYATRHLAYPNNYVAYASDPADVCSTEYYYMPADGVYYCYAPDPVARNSNLQSTCPDQPYLYICPS
jgi:hypothetical protein